MDYLTKFSDLCLAIPPRCRNMTKDSLEINRFILPIH